MRGYAIDTGTLERRLAEWCAERLAPYKRPRGWRWIEGVPRNALGKVLRHELEQHGRHPLARQRRYAR